MKKLLLPISLITISILFSGCCHLFFCPGHGHNSGHSHGMKHGR